MSITTIILIFAIPFLPLLTGLRRSFAPLGGPLTIVALQFFLGVTLKSIYLAFNQDLFSELIWLSRSLTSYEIALIFSLTFSILICMGYLLAVGKKNDEIFNSLLLPVRISSRKSVILITIATVSFVIISSAFINNRELSGESILDVFIQANLSKVDRIEGVGEFGNTNAFIAVFFVIPEICLFLFYSKVTTGSKLFLHHFGFWFTTLLILASAFLRGKRDDLAVLILSLIIIASLLKGRVTWRDLRQYLPIFIVIISIFSIITLLRGSSGGELEFITFSSGQLLIEPILGSTYFTDINILASIIERMESWQFMDGSSYLSFFPGLIPRVFWADKPAVSLGLFVKSEILQRPGTLGGIPPTMPGEAYINFGWIGLSVGLVYGYCLRKIEVLLLSGKFLSQQIGLYIYALCIVPLTWSLMQSSFAITMNGVVVSTFIALPVLLFAKHNKKVHHTSH